MTSDTPNYDEIKLDILRKWLTDEKVCAAVLHGSCLCLRISRCSSAYCGLAEAEPDPK